VTPDITSALHEIANRPTASWRALLHRRFPDDPVLVHQALVWLHANHEPGETPEFERYRLGVMLDGGGTAAVWQAYDLKLGRNVAIKLFRIERSPSLEEILAEARAACDVTSDHVVRVFDVHDDDPPYIVMELVGEHEPRRGMLAPGASAASCRPASVDEAVRWVRDVALGVRDAHLRNVFHRDLKPHNVLITPLSRRARVGDFGLAISSAGAAGTAVGLVRTGSSGPVRVAGTPEYMSPEQARGLPLVLDPRDPDDRAVLVGVDVWGLGAIAYDLIASRPPWRATDGLEAWEVAATAAPPSLDGTVPRRLAKVIAKALAAEPSARYATAGELADELDAYLARRPTSHDRSRAVRAWLWSRRNPQLTITAMLAVVLAIFTSIAYATVVAVGHQRNELAAEISRAQVERTELEVHASTLHAELADTQANLDTLHHTLAEAKQDYDTIVAAKERALDKADAMTRNLVDQLAAMRNERDTAEKGRELYEGFWTRARAEADEAARDRDEAQQERDSARKDRDQVAKERDAARDARSVAEKERDTAKADRDRIDLARRHAEADLARLAAELSTIGGLARDAGVDAPAPAPAHVAPDAPAPAKAD
jgi:serine/threonine protein kinase